MLGKNTILKAIHNYAVKILPIAWVWMLGKNTILKAIHNIQMERLMLWIGVNAG